MIVVYESSLRDKIVREFNSYQSFGYWMENEKNPGFDVDPDQVEVNGTPLPDWEYLDQFIR